MTSESLYQRAKDAFLRVCDAEPAERVALLEEICAGDEALRAEVLSLLSHDLDDGAFGDHLPPGSTLGDFEVVRVLGEGAMGVVYEARQAHPERMVALKVVRGGAASASLRRRFEHESAALARLQHPGIAAVYEAGFDRATGAPFFAMELVQGRPLTAHAAELSLAQRVELLAQVADAVHHAHQRGVIHRDLKPGNILVDQQGRPRVLDFGIARLTADDGTAATIRTLPGQVVGTLAYMSPEQASGDAAAIDVRTDIYALGAVGYELLSGQLPLAVRDMPLAAALGAIQDDEPRRLGTLDKRLRGDLETIISTALEKDASRRYPSAAALADDLRRWLRDEPITARPATTLYQLRKFAKRRKGPVITGGVIAAMLVVASIVSVAFGVHAQRQRTLAEQRLVDVRALANTMLFDLHDLIEPLPGAIEARRRLVRTGLEYLDRLAQDAGKNPELLEELAEAYFRIGDIQGNPRRANLGDAEAALASYATSIDLRRRLAEAVPSEASTIALARTELAIAETLTSTPRADESADYAQRTLDTLDGLETNAADEVRLLAEQRLGTAMLNRGQPDEALEHFSRALEASERLAAGGDPVLVRRLTIGLNEMGLTLARLGRADEALPYLERSESLRAAAAEANPGSVRAQRDLALVQHRLGDVRGDMGEKDEAVRLYASARDALAGIAQADSSDARAHFDWSVAEEKLANAQLRVDRIEEAKQGFANARDLRTNLADANPENRLYRMASAIAIERVAHCDRLRGNHDAARLGFHDAMAIARDGLEDNPSDVRLWTVLGISQRGLGESFLDADDANAEDARRWLNEARATLDDMAARGMTPTRSTLSAEVIDALLLRCG
ncbi:MAG: serine/threonine-protein kinase [Phycisphaerales bacterium]|jgi:tetratricopeptide (TPR) repeat protein/predicted Ser/Thr protein kinase